MNHFLKRIPVLFLFMLCLGCQKKNADQKPNVILILTDDQGYGDLGIHGNLQIKTPVLDQFAKESARFDRFYVSPLCAPTRASLLTGRYHLRTGTISVSNGLETMDAEEYTLAELFKDNGYTTSVFGKWHNGQHYPHHPLAQGFDEFTGFLAGHWSNYFDTKLEKNGKVQTFEGFVPDVLTDEALAFIEKNKDQPFFTYLAYNTPHSPHQVPEEFFSPYKGAGLNDELAAVYGMVSNLDQNVGRILEKLKELELDENTLIIFLTDNGPNGVRFNAEMKGVKGSVHEGGVRVPSFWRWPGHISPGLISTPAAHIDVLPTLAELLELEFNENRPLDGNSLAPSLSGKQQELDRSIFSHVAFPQQKLRPVPGAIRKDSLLLTLLPGGAELYDLKNDPNQSTNLAVNFPDLVNILSGEYQNWWENVSAKSNPDRPIPISRLSPEIFLPGYEAVFSGEISFYEGHGWAQDWLTNWINEADSIFWRLNVLDPGEFEVWISYAADSGQTGSQLELRAGKETIHWAIKDPFVPEKIQSPDRVPRKEAPEQTWKKTKMGSLRLEKGPIQLNLGASFIPIDGVGDLYSLSLVPVGQKK